MNSYSTPGGPPLNSAIMIEEPAGPQVDPWLMPTPVRVSRLKLFGPYQSSTLR